jgi:hypothetical protein
MSDLVIQDHWDDSSGRGNHQSRLARRRHHPLVVGDDCAELIAERTGSCDMNRVETPQDTTIQHGGCVEQLVVQLDLPNR